jgi:hypothetical protein
MERISRLLAAWACSWPAFGGCSGAAAVPLGFFALRGQRGAWAMAGRPTIVVGILFVGGFLLPSAKGVGVGDRKVSNVDRCGGGEEGSNVVFLNFF